MILLKRLKDLREDRDIPIQEMLDLLHVSRTTYYNYESGNSFPTFDTLIKIADYFNVSVDFLIGRDYESQKIYNQTNLFLGCFNPQDIEKELTDKEKNILKELIQLLLSRH